MTTGYLWSGQFEELTKVINEGQPQSMELDSDSLQGHWATDNNLGIDFFIITDATFSKLCILGDNVEPCYEGASVTSPEVSRNFSNSPEFQQTLFTMMKDLQAALDSKGGLNVSENELLNENKSADSVDENMLENTLEQTEEVIEETETVTTEEVDDNFTVEETVEETAEAEETLVENEFEAEENKAESAENENIFTHTEEEFVALNEELESLRAEIVELRNFKLEVENQQKDALIASYHMLSDEDKADVIAHKSEYTMEEIKAKLAVIYVDKNVNFDMIDGQEEVVEETAPIMTFSLDEEASEGVPAFIEALRHTSK